MSNHIQMTFRPARRLLAQWIKLPPRDSRLSTLNDDDDDDTANVARQLVKLCLKQQKKKKTQTANG